MTYLSVGMAIGVIALISYCKNQIPASKKINRISNNVIANVKVISNENKKYLKEITIRKVEIQIEIKLSDFPKDLLITIFKLVDISSVFNISLTNKQFRTFILENNILTQEKVKDLFFSRLLKTITLQSNWITSPSKNEDIDKAQHDERKIHAVEGKIFFSDRYHLHIYDSTELGWKKTEIKAYPSFDSITRKHHFINSIVYKDECLFTSAYGSSQIKIWRNGDNGWENHDTLNLTKRVEILDFSYEEKLSVGSFCFLDDALIIACDHKNLLQLWKRTEDQHWQKKDEVSLSNDSTTFLTSIYAGDGSIFCADMSCNAYENKIFIYQSVNGRLLKKDQLNITGVVRSIYYGERKLFISRSYGEGEILIYEAINNLWQNTHSLKERGSFIPHSLTFIGETLVGLTNSGVQLWKVTEKGLEEKHTLFKNDENVASLDYRLGKIYTLSTEGDVKVWHKSQNIASNTSSQADTKES